MTRADPMEARLPSLDGWRALAITLVLLSHAWAARNPVQFPEFMRVVTTQGDFGVRIFFVISGFLITLLLVTERRRTGAISLRNFYIRRALRIFPVYYLFLLVLAGLQAASLYSDALSTWFGSLTYTRNMVGRGNSATGHLWSFAVEEQFYLIWPAALVALGLCRRWRLAISLLLVVVATSFSIRLLDCHSSALFCTRVLGEKSALRYADSLAVGCIGAFLYANTHIRIADRAQATLLYVVIAALAGSAALEPATRVEASTLIVMQAVVTMAGVVLSMTTKYTVLFRILNSRPLVYIGLISYSLYIWHIIFLSEYVGGQISGTVLDDGRYWWIASLAIASISYFLFERPLLRLKSRLQRPPAPAAGMGPQLSARGGTT